VAEKKYRLAFIQPYDEPILPRDRPKKDDDLGLLRVRSRKSSEFVFVESIVRGALLATDPDVHRKHDRLVIDTVDTDMFLRLRSLTF
jgi:hypothetical protein